MNRDTFYLPSGGSTFAKDVDGLYYSIYWLCVVLFVGILVTMSYFAYKYRRRQASEIPTGGPTHATGLELFWSITPLFIVMAIFFAGFKGYLKMAIAPSNAMEIMVTARKWSWQFVYPQNGYSEVNQLVVPKGVPIKLIMNSSEDSNLISPVIHSFFVPSFRIKKDLVPGQYSTLWFEATEVGKFQIYCTEYCGDGHSDMLATLVVKEQDEFVKWLDGVANAKIVPTAELGEKLYRKLNCYTCHSDDGTTKNAPSFKGLWEKNELLSDDTGVSVDANYIRESVLRPQAKIVKGFEPSKGIVMPTYQGSIKDGEITAVIEYIKSLK